MMLTQSAPAKLNLFLHITGKREDGYHLLDSLVVFTEFADQITFTKSSDFRFSCSGAYSEHIDPVHNLVTQAIQNLAETHPHVSNIRIHLEKNIPVGGGLGGGSSDAAATLLALNRFFALDIPIEQLFETGLTIGADIPVCLMASSAHMTGIGENVSPVHCPNLSLLLVNPGIQIPTKEVFQNRQTSAIHQKHAELPNLKDYPALIHFLKEQDNDLFESASSLYPVLKNVIHEISLQEGCDLARMSGSGATCFGIFEHQAHAEKARDLIKKRHPDWFVRVTHTL